MCATLPLAAVCRKTSRCCLQGLRVLGVATRSLDNSHTIINAGNECLMVFRGFLTLRDEVKASAGPALRSLMKNGVAVKVEIFLPYDIAQATAKPKNDVYRLF